MREMSFFGSIMRFSVVREKMDDVFRIVRGIFGEVASILLLAFIIMLIVQIFMLIFSLLDPLRKYQPSFQIEMNRYEKFELPENCFKGELSLVTPVFGNISKIIEKNELDAVMVLRHPEWINMIFADVYVYDPSVNPVLSVSRHVDDDSSMSKQVARMSFFARSTMVKQKHIWNISEVFYWDSEGKRIKSVEKTMKYNMKDNSIIVIPQCTGTSKEDIDLLFLIEEYVKNREAQKQQKTINAFG